MLASRYILIPGLRCIIKISLRGVYFKFIYLMTNPRLSSAFKRNIFLTKILANAPLTTSMYILTYFFELYFSFWIKPLLLRNKSYSPSFILVCSCQMNNPVAKHWSRSLAGKVIREGWDGRDDKSHSSPKYQINKNPFKN